MKNFKFLFLLFLVAAACTTNEEQARLDVIESYNNTATSRKSLATLATNKINAENDATFNQADQRKLIKNGNVSFEVDDLKATQKRIEQLIKDVKGYVSSDNTYSSSDQISNTISVRIPTDSFDNFMEKLSQGVKKFDNRNTNIRDVTEQYLDLEARLKTRKLLEQKYLELLKKAKNVSEVLSVERELGKVREEIESAEGRIKYLQNQVSYSSLTINFYTKIASSESGFLGQVKGSFKKGLENIKTVFMMGISFWPFLLVFIGVVWYLKKKKTSKS
ncbi:hypothetical protein GCM10011416_19050 [Polaribacter pacificus]|uniref:DUF4349 domain-containing protein n=1 Tax=Polaribacter pacificus TaxID=1775173 RepID=A0A917MEK2_9FLAO|nr:DUF4349 domain-containing protein [Polaribacter pacificus]GGH00616.1 hypothetical protein GCM10011416_19050 [Polaribacter pacificus]